MDDDENTSKATHFSCEENESKQTIHPDIERLRNETELQAKTIESLSKTVAVLEAERSQTFNALSHLQAELYNLVRELAGHNLSERFEALHREVSMEVHYLRCVLLPSHGPCCSSASCSRPHLPEFQNQATISHISQELYHCQRILWEQIAELKEEVHKIRSQFNFHKVDVLNRLDESNHNNMCTEMRTDKCQVQESSIQKRSTLQDTNGVRYDMSEIQNKIQNIVISKGEAPKKTGHGMKTNQRHLVPSSDSDEGLNTKQTRTTKCRDAVDITARRK